MMQPIDGSHADVNGDEPFNPNASLDRNLTLLDRYLSQELTAEESLDVRRRMREDREFWEHVEPIVAFMGLAMLADGYDPAEPVLLEGPAFQELLRAAQSPILALPSPAYSLIPPADPQPVDVALQSSRPLPPPILAERRPSRRSKWGRRLLKVVIAIVVLFFGLGLAFAIQVAHIRRTVQAAAAAQMAGRSNPIGFNPEKVVNTGPNGTQVISLDHGSTITMRGGSRVSYRITGLQGHHVALDGEGVFDVRDDWVLLTGVGIVDLSPGRYAISCDTLGRMMLVNVGAGSADVQSYEKHAVPVTVPSGDGLRMTADGVTMLSTDTRGFPSLGTPQ